MGEEKQIPGRKEKDKRGHCRAVASTEGGISGRKLHQSRSESGNGRGGGENPESEEGGAREPLWGRVGQKGGSHKWAKMIEIFGLKPMVKKEKPVKGVKKDGGRPEIVV